MATIKNIFSFLKDYNDIRNPVITDISRQIWHYKLSDLPSINELWSVYDTNDFESLNILEIERPVILPCPSPDESIIPWIDKTWEKLSLSDVPYIESKTSNGKDENDELVETIEYFTDHKDRVDKYNAWTSERKNWLEIETPKEIGLKFYNDLFSLYSDFKRESESLELVLGDGFISWTTEGRLINHPVLLQKVNLIFNSNKPSFIITCDEIKTELYTPMLRVINSINQAMLPEIIKEVEDKGFHIADKANSIEGYKRLINVINEKGSFVEQIDKTSQNPTISYEPILFVRKRNLGFTEFINKVIDDIDSKEEDIVLPDFFKNILGDYVDTEIIEEVGENWNQSGIDEDILLTLPANNEQMKIIKYLDNYGAVLVQGPPGTGKTHTIANLIGHLLSRGDRVLVTSHTEKALSVLKDKVYKDLQSLCISLLSSSSERKEMDATLFEIAEKSTSLDQTSSLNRINRLETERKELIARYKERKAELLQVRSLQYNDIVYGNTTIKPIEAAKFICEGKNTLDYIPGKTTDDNVLLTVDIEDLSYLYKSNGLITKDEEEFLYKELPDMNSIWTSNELKVSNEEISKYKAELEGWIQEFIFRDTTTKDELIGLLNHSKNILDSIDRMSDFERVVVNKNIIDSVYETFWEDVFEAFEELMLNYESYRKLLFYNNYDIPNNLYRTEAIVILEEIIDSGKEIPVNLMVGLLKPKWKKIRDSITISRKPLEKIQEYKDVRFIIDYALKKEGIVNKINRLIYGLQGQEKIENDETEEKLKILLDRVKYSLYWYKENWISYIGELRSYITNLDDQKINLQVDNPVESICDLTNNYLALNINNYHTSLKLEEEVQKREEYLDLLASYVNKGLIFNKLIDAVEIGDIDSYAYHHKELSEIYAKYEMNIRRHETLEKLAKYAPEWAYAIKDREGIHGDSSQAFKRFLWSKY